MTDIIITRPKNDCRSLAKMLLDCSVQVHYIPILKFKYYKLIVSDSYDYYIITSKKAIKFIEIQQLKDAIFLVNGKSLFTYVSKKFPANRVINTGNYAKDIYCYIKNNIPKGKFAYLRGSEVSFNFKLTMEPLGFIVNEFINYESMASMANISKILKLTNKGKFILTFFSSKAANSFVHKATEQNATENLNNHIALCFSDKIASQIPKRLFHKCTSSEPDLDQFAQLINNNI